MNRIAPSQRKSMKLRWSSVEITNQRNAMQQRGTHESYFIDGVNMSESSNPGRVAGFLYLLLVVLAPFRLFYIPSTLFERGNASETASNIAAHQLLFRLGMLSELLCGVILIFLTLALYRLLKGVDQYYAVLMVIVGGLMPATIDFLNVLNDGAALIRFKARISSQHSRNHKRTRSPCCSCVCTTIALSPRRSCGGYGSFL